MNQIVKFEILYTIVNRVIISCSFRYLYLFKLFIDFQLIIIIYTWIIYPNVEMDWIVWVFYLFVKHNNSYSYKGNF